MSVAFVFVPVPFSATLCATTYLVFPFSAAPGSVSLPLSFQRQPLADLTREIDSYLKSLRNWWLFGIASVCSPIFTLPYSPTKMAVHEFSVGPGSVYRLKHGRFGNGFSRSDHNRPCNRAFFTQTRAIHQRVPAKNLRFKRVPSSKPWKSDYRGLGNTWSLEWHLAEIQVPHLGLKNVGACVWLWPAWEENVQKRVMGFVHTLLDTAERVIAFNCQRNGHQGTCPRAWKAGLSGLCTLNFVLSLSLSLSLSLFLFPFRFVSLPASYVSRAIFSLRSWIN